MYQGGYGFPNAGGGGPAFNGAPPPQNHHMQPGPGQGQPQQQMMYNTQQFPMGAQGGHFQGGPNPAMMGAAGPAGMMQNAAMPQHMAAAAAANGQSKLPPVSTYLLSPTSSHAVPLSLPPPLASDVAITILTCLFLPVVSPCCMLSTRLFGYGPCLDKARTASHPFSAL
jgi:hypothetical protein